MRGFTDLRRAAGLGNRKKFAVVTGISLRSLSAFDNDHRDPPVLLIRYLRLLAGGCRFCPNLKRENQPKENNTCPQTK